MGRHASQDSRRRLAAWPVIAVVAVLVVAALVVGYFFLLNKDRGTAACTGATVLPVTAAPGAAPSIADAAQQFSSTAPVARGTCVSVRVTTMAGAAAAQALSQNWKGQTPPRPRPLGRRLHRGHRYARRRQFGDDGGSFGHRPGYLPGGTGRSRASG